MFEAIRNMENDGSLCHYFNILGSENSNAMTASAIWMQISEWLCLWGNVYFDGGQHWLNEFKDMLDQEEVWRQTVARPSKHLAVSPAFAWECFCQSIDTFPYRLADWLVVTSLNAYRSRNVHPGLFEYVLEITLGDNNTVVEVTYRPRKRPVETFILFR